MKPLEVAFGHDRMHRYDGRVDACIVGCGAGGSTLAKELAERGWKVVVFEAGDWLDTDEDLRQDELTMLGRFDWDDRRWLAGSEELELGHRRDGRGVGGGTIHFGGVTLRLWPEDFAKAGEGWWGERLMEWLRAYPNTLILGTEGECLAYEHNRVDLSDDFDEYGLPRPSITFDYGDNERAMRDEIHRIALEILDAAGASEVIISEGNDHTMGGCRMGNDPATSVVNAELRCHDHPNLYICDASVFVTPGGAQPSQTIQALALRLAEHLDMRGAA